MKKYDTEETHILDQAKTYFGTHRFFKWPAFFLFITIGALILSKEIGEAIEYLSNKLKITHSENSATENIAKEKEPRPVATISAQDTKKNLHSQHLQHRQKNSNQLHLRKFKIHRLRRNCPR